ncbi:MAG: Ig-like domain-containing protein [Clostridia bacterium]|nr:Ig-like domain-containing protein [Clostridia bacterium]
MKKVKLRKGISLITLVVTIIVVLIIAGVVVLNIAKNNPVEQARNAVRLSNEKAVEEEISLAMLNLQNEYYTGKYLEPNNTMTFADYAKSRLEGEGVNTGNGVLKLNPDGTVSYDNGSNLTAIGTFDPVTGKITVDEVHTAGIYTEPKHLLVYEVTSISKVYGSENFTNELTVKKDGLTIAYSSTDTSVATVDSTTGEVTIVGIGNAVIMAEAAAENQIASYALEVTRDGMEYTVTGFHDEYDGLAHGVTINVTKPVEATIKYGEEEGTYDLEESPSLTNAGSLTVYYEITNSNYETVTGSETIVIEKAGGVIGYEVIQFTKTPADEAFTNELTKVGDGTVTYSSSNMSVASVNGTTGEITIVGLGTTIITASVMDSANYEYVENTATYTLVVNKREGVISYNVTEMTKVVGDDSFTNPITKNGDGAVTFSSSDSTIASIDSSSGEVTITGYGTVTITASVTDTAEYAYVPSTAIYTLTVERVAASMSYSDLTVNKYVGDVSFTNELTNLGNGNVTYESNDTTVATVDSSTGEVTIVGAGSAVITATTNDTATYTYETKTANYTLNVSKRAAEISFEISSVDKYVDESSFTNIITNTGDGVVTYESLDTSVASVDSSTGSVMINALGTAVITATVIDSSTYTYETKNVTYTLTVSKHNGSISYAITEVSKQVGDVAFINTLTKIGNGTVTYESSNTSVASVDSSTGSVTINALGTAVITATVIDSSTYTYETKNVMYTLNVKNEGSLTLSLSSLAMNYNRSRSITITNPNSVNITVESSDTTVATVTKNSNTQITINSKSIEGNVTIIVIGAESSTVSEVTKEIKVAVWNGNGTLTVEKAKEVINGDNISCFIGTPISYSPTGGGTWHIFYLDTTNKYGDGKNTLYIKRAYDSNSTDEISTNSSSATYYSSQNNNSIKAEILADMRKIQSRVEEK